MTRRRRNLPLTPPTELRRQEYIGHTRVAEHVETDVGDIMVSINNIPTFESFEEAVARVKAADGGIVEPKTAPTRAEFEAMTAPRTLGQKISRAWEALRRMWREAGIYNDFKADGASDPWSATKRALYLEENYIVAFRIYASKRYMAGHDLASSREAFLQFRTSALTPPERVHVREALMAMDEDEAFLPDAKRAYDKDTADLMKRLEQDLENLPMTPAQHYIYTGAHRA